MKKLRYGLRFTGIPEESGRISAERLEHALHALRQIAERATRLVAEGEGRGRGSKPAWLQATINFTVAGMKSGSTVLELEAPQLRDTAYEMFGQEDFWLEKPDLGNTALDITAQAVNEAAHKLSQGNHFDRAVLDAILGFKKSVNGAGTGARLRLERQDDADIRFELNKQSFEQIEQHRQSIPSPQMHIASGRLDEIQYGGGRFRLLLGKRRSVLPGRLLPEALDPEVLRPLWGKPVFVEGRVHFKANGQPRMIEAVKVVKCEKEDNIFQRMPVPEESIFSDRATKKRHRAKGFDPRVLAGSWPGDESLEELLADLD